MIQAIQKEVWWDAPPDAVAAALREALAQCAMEICHETGDEDSYVQFCATTIRAWLAVDPPTEPFGRGVTAGFPDGRKR